MIEGRIVKSLSGFDTVKSDKGLFTCKGRGVFRNQNITPLVGDFVLFKKTDEQTGYITKIEARKNELIRPPIANVTQAIIVHSACQPTFNPLLLDRFLVLVESEQISPMIVITKLDLASESEIDRVNQFKSEYEEIGYNVQLLFLHEEQALTSIQRFFPDEVTVVTGQSGVGKSTLLNRIRPDLSIETGEISKTLGRGKHTTRHVELIEIKDGLVADTPGFSSLEFTSIEPEQLSLYFKEMKEFVHQCKFRGCLHHKEPKCAVKQAVKDEVINSFRYDHYIKFLQEIMLRKPRY